MKIACIVADGFEDSELRIPVDELTRAGHIVELVGEREGEELVGERGRERVEPAVSIATARADDYDALLIPGGYSPDRLRADRRFVDFVRAFDREKKLIAAVCHGPQLLLTAGLVRGRTLTAWKTVQGDLRCGGAKVEDREVVVDRNWITSRHPGDLGAFSRAIVDALGPTAETHAPPAI